MKAIYIDLDDCLIHSIFGNGNAKKRTTMHLENEKYRVLERPLARQMLDDLRALGPVRMLTTATPDYAQEANRLFNFGFLAQDIISLVPLLETIQLAYGSDTLLTKTHTDPKGVLIDHQKPHEKWLRIKLLYLGIKESSYVQVREFSGLDPQKFANEWRNIHLPLVQTIMRKDLP
jgi:hypothetical protein